jgi:hypothetical protein
MGRASTIANVRTGRSQKRDEDEAGAVLILALVFILATSLVIAGLLAWSGRDLSNVSSFQQNRVQNNAMNSAVETAIQSVRYSPTACPSGGLQVPVPNPNSQFNQVIDVWCSTLTNNGSIQTRTVTLAACPDTAFTKGQCTNGFASPNPPPYLTVVVIFDDYADVNGIPPVASPTYHCTVTCGATMGVQSWTFKET